MKSKRITKCQFNFHGLVNFLIISLQLHLSNSYSINMRNPNSLPAASAAHQQFPSTGESLTDDYATSNPSKLMLILIDGMRWDYYTRQKKQLPGFSRFISEGVHVKYVEPMFPSLSFPTWTTIATGLYPEEHNILGNFMLAFPNTNVTEGPSVETIFQFKDNSTELPFWWQSAEPIWTTATKNNRIVSLANWARCDVPIGGITPAECRNYAYQDVNLGFRSDLQTGLKRLKNGYSLSMVYDDFIDHVGHQFGPNSPELELAMIERDNSILELLMNIQLSGLSNKINVVITSDHGMTSLKNATPIYLSDYVDEDDIHKVVDYGAIVSIAAAPNRTESLATNLSAIPGVISYTKTDIPEEFHYQKGKFVLDFLLIAQPGYYIVGLKGEKQIPNDAKSSSSNPYRGVHGYHNMTDMRTVFFAKGPAFKQGITHPPIRVVDQYQIFMKVLGLDPLTNHGKWESVADMFS